MEKTLYEEIFYGGYIIQKGYIYKRDIYIESIYT